MIRTGRIIGKKRTFRKNKRFISDQNFLSGARCPNQINKRGITGCGQTSDV